MTRAWRLVPLGVLLACMVSCLTYTRSQIIVARRGSQAHDVKQVESICGAVAERHSLMPRPFPQKYGHIAAWARPAGRDFTGPAIYTNASDPDPNTLVTVTVIGEPLSDAGRKEIAAELFKQLQHTFGTARVKSQENPYTEF